MFEKWQFCGIIVAVIAYRRGEALRAIVGSSYASACKGGYHPPIVGAKHCEPERRIND